MPVLGFFVRWSLALAELKLVFEVWHALLRSRPVSVSETVAYTVLKKVSAAELANRISTTGGRGEGRGVVVGSGLASGSRGRR